ncbi:MAG: hypothetical protein R2751_14695 [Bacteroidales bacterium]
MQKRNGSKPSWNSTSSGAPGNDENALSHSGASHIVIQLIRHESSLVLMTEDDGAGFDPAKPGPKAQASV